MGRWLDLPLSRESWENQFKGKQPRDRLNKEGLSPTLGSALSCASFRFRLKMKSELETDKEKQANGSFYKKTD